MNDSPVRRPSEGLGRPPMMVLVPLMSVIALAVAWSVLWYMGTRRGDAMIDEWLAAEAARGRTYDCAERTIGGYPFRVEVECVEPTADIADADPRLRLAAGRLHAVAMLWDLEHVIVEMDGPFTFAAGAGGDIAGEADWSRLQTSLRVPGGRISRLDMVVEDLEIAPANGARAGASAERFELHHQQAPDAPDAEVAVSASGVVVRVDGLPEAEPVDLALLSRIVAVPDPMPRAPADFLAAWRDNEGAYDLTEFRATQGESVISASGRMVPDEAGRPEGTLTVTLAGPDVAAPGTARAFGGIAPVLATALMLGGRQSELDGKRAVAGDLEFVDGGVRFGPLRLGSIPRLF